MSFKVIALAILSIATCKAQSGHGGHGTGASYVSFSLGHGGLGGNGGGLGGGSGGSLGGSQGYSGGLLQTAQVGGSEGHGHGHYVDYHTHPKYQFKYGVADAHTKDHHSQQEVRDGDVVHGEYSLQEPDGTIRIVKYTADHKNGFNAQVIRQGHAVHPETTHKSNFAVFHGHGLGGGQGGSAGHGGY